MARPDDVITGHRTNRRDLLKRTAALGVAVPALSLGTRGLLSAGAQGRSSVRWVSPRATLEVLDDYPYWVAQKLGYFGDLETQIDPGIAETTGGLKAVAEDQSDVAFPSPGAFSLGVEGGIDLVSVFQMGAYDVFDIAVQKGNPSGITTVKDLEGKTLSVLDAGWSGIVDPMVAQAGGDPSLVRYQPVGVAWGQVLKEGQVDATLSWAGLRAQWLAQGLDFDYIIGKSWSKFPANSFVIRRSDAEDPELDQLYATYLKGWAMGLEFGHHNPRAAVQITMEADPIGPALQATFPDKSLAVQSMWQLADVFRGDFPNRDGGKWGWHSTESWTVFLDTIKEIGQLTSDLKAEDITSNKYVAGANDFDREQVKADAAAFALSPEFEAVAVPEGAGSEGAYPS